MSTSKVSFTVRKPAPMSRQSSSGVDSDPDTAFKVPKLPPHARHGSSTPPTGSRLRHENGKPPPSRNRSNLAQRYDVRDSSDEEEDAAVDEIVTGFDEFGVQRLQEKPKAGPLVIPAQQNRDWRELARKRKGATMFVPEAGKAGTGADGSVGGLGTRDTINSGVVRQGLVIAPTVKKEEEMDDSEVAEAEEPAMAVEESEDDRARRILLASLSGDKDPGEAMTIDVIPVNGNTFSRVSEKDALLQDIAVLPDESSLDDYERVPIAEFGAALLRGMGWKPGTAASRTRKGPLEPYIPTARPALLGIGAKERVVEDDGSKGQKGGKPVKSFRKPDMKYIPLVKRERDGGSSSSAPPSRRSSRSPDPQRRKERDREYDRRDRSHDRNYSSDRDHDRDRGYRDRDSDRDKRKDKNYDSDRGDRRDRDRDYDRKDRDRRSDKDRESDRDRRRH